MWYAFLFLSILSLILTVAIAFLINKTWLLHKKKLNLFNALFLGIFIATFFAFLPIYLGNGALSQLGIFRAFLLTLFDSIQTVIAGSDVGAVAEGVKGCPIELNLIYQVWMLAIFVLEPILALGFVLSLFKNISAYLKYLAACLRHVYVFSELNEKSLALATDIKKNKKKAVIVFTNVVKDKNEKLLELIEKTKIISTINFEKEISTINFFIHSKRKSISFFAIGENDADNIECGIKLVKKYNKRKNVNVYVFSAKTESELLFEALDKGKVKVRRINEVQSLINKVLYECGNSFFDNAQEDIDGTKKVSAVIVGMGNYGTEMTKALAWFCQMDGYRIEINAFDKDSQAEEKFIALAPELMSKEYNGVINEGEAQYSIAVHSGVDVNTISFADELKKIKNVTYALVALDSDDTNIHTAVMLRMYFERMGIHPVIQAIVHNSQRRNALTGIKNVKGQAYDIEFIGDIDSLYAVDVIIASPLEHEALERHLKWGSEEEFWQYEYNYRSSIASAIHMRARVNCNIPGADKKEEELTKEERDIIEVLEHRRWNAYMRAEGFVFSGSKDASSRNYLAKTHHDLVDFSSLSEEDKRKDSRVGSK